VETNHKDQLQADNKRMVRRLLFVVLGMFGFGFALVPLYDVFCDITGLNGKTGGVYTQKELVEINNSRIVTVQFMANNNDGMTWQFKPTQKSVQVHPGALTEVSFYVRNTSDRTMIAQAVPSVSPFYAADYLHKTECFCFEQQLLHTNEEMEMPLRFIVDNELPDDVSTLTLSYTLFDVTELASSN